MHTHVNQAAETSAHQSSVVLDLELAGGRAFNALHSHGVAFVHSQALHWRRQVPI